MRHEFQYTFDEPFLRTALKRDIAWRGAYAMIAFALLLAGVWLWTRQLSPLTLAIVGAGVVLLWGLLYRAWCLGAVRLVELWSKQSPDRVMAFRLDDEGFDVDVGSAHARYTWAGLRRLWRYSDVWIIEIVKNLSVFFPPEAASEEARAFIVERCEANGVRT